MNQQPVEASARLSLARVYEGWDGYQISLARAIAPLTPAQLAWRPAPQLRSVGELARHIALGRIGWFLRMDAPGSAALARAIDAWEYDRDGNRYIVEERVVGAEDPAALIHWLEASWQMIAATLATWTVDDLARAYRHTYWGRAYLVSRQWTLWRIMAHDIHHGGQLAVMLGMQGIAIPELGDLGGHLTEPPLADLAVVQ